MAIVFFSAARAAKNSPELYFRFLIFLLNHLCQNLWFSFYSFFTIGDVITNTTELGYCSPPERDNLVYKTGCDVIKHPYARTECYCKGPLCNFDDLVPE